MNRQSLQRTVKNFFTANTLLLFLLCVMIFGTTLLPESWYRSAYSILINLILICIIFCLDKSHQLFNNIAVTILVIILNIAFFTKAQFANAISDGLNGLFFLFAFTRLLKQVAHSKVVTPKVIVQSVSCYLLLGLLFSMGVARLESIHPGSFSFPADEMGSFQAKYYDQLYFSFVTMGTVGYGDFLPKTPFAKSFSTLIGVTGQLYVAIIISMLIGKFSSTSSQPSQ